MVRLHPEYARRLASGLQPWFGSRPSRGARPRGGLVKGFGGLFGKSDRLIAGSCPLDKGTSFGNRKIADRSSMNAFGSFNAFFASAVP